MKTMLFAYRFVHLAKVLLAPACASFDMFDNFEHRGNVFKDLVQQLVVNT